LLIDHPRLIERHLPPRQSLSGSENTLLSGPEEMRSDCKMQGTGMRILLCAASLGVFVSFSMLAAVHLLLD
jgi:hypothetical protein